MLSLPQSNFAQKFKVYASAEIYLNETVERTGFDRNKIVLENLLYNKEFENELDENHLFTFFGIAYNDELFSASKLESKSCWGQFLELCENIKEEEHDPNDKKVSEISYLKNLNFDKTKKTVIFIYSDDLTKRKIKIFIKTILKETEKDPSFDYIVLSLDSIRIRKS